MAVACTPLPRLRADRSRSFEKGTVSRATPSAFPICLDAAGLRMLFERLAELNSEQSE